MAHINEIGHCLYPDSRPNSLLCTPSNVSLWTSFVGVHWTSAARGSVKLDACRIQQGVTGLAAEFSRPAGLNSAELSCGDGEADRVISPAAECRTHRRRRSPRWTFFLRPTSRRGESIRRQWRRHPTTAARRQTRRACSKLGAAGRAASRDSPHRPRDPRGSPRYPPPPLTDVPPN